jgi:hypothetical protein
VAKKDENTDLAKLIAALSKLTKELGEAVGLPFFNLEKTPGTLYPGEEKRAKKIADIFKNVFGKDLGVKTSDSKGSKTETKGEDAKYTKIANIFKSVFSEEFKKIIDDSNSDEDRRYTKQAEIFRNVFSEEFKKIVDDSNADEDRRYKKQTEIFKSTFSKELKSIADVLSKKDTDDKSKKEKSDSKSSGISKLLSENKGLTGILSFGVGLYFIINSLIKASSIDLAGAAKAVLAIGAFAKIFLMLSDKKESLIKSSAAFAIFASTFNFIIIPLFNKLAAMPLEQIMASLLKFGLIFFALNKLISYIEKSVNTKQLRQISVSFGIFALTVGLIILPTLNILNKINTFQLISSLIKFGLIFFTLNKLISYIEKSVNVKQLRQISIAYGLFGLSIGLVVLPTLILINKIPIIQLISSLIKFGLVFYALNRLILTIEKSVNAKQLKQISIAYGLFGLSIGLVILPTLNLIHKIPIEQLFKSIVKFGLLFGALSLLILTIHKSADPKKLKEISIAYGLFGLVIGLIILPTLKLIAKIPFDILLNGLFKMGLVMIGLSLFIKILGKVANTAKKDLIIGLATFAIMSFVLGYVFNVLNKFAVGMDWTNIAKNIALSSLTIILFGVLLTGIGALLTGPLGLFIAVGAVAIIGLSFVLDKLIDTITNFSDKDWKSISLGIKNGAAAIMGLMEMITKISYVALKSSVAILLGFIPLKVALSTVDSIVNIFEKLNKLKIEPSNITKIGDSLVFLGDGLSKFAQSMTAGFSNLVLDKVSSFFGVDIFSKIEKFIGLDGERLQLVGMGFNYLANGLKNLSSVKLSSDVIASDITKLIKPILEFSTALTKFSSAYSVLDKILKSTDFAAKIDLNLKSENEYQISIIELQKRQVSLQEAQLNQLQVNGSKLDNIAEKILLMGSSNNRMGIVAANNQATVTMKSQNFSTKDDYMNNMKLMTGMLQA